MLSFNDLLTAWEEARQQHEGKLREYQSSEEIAEQLGISVPNVRKLLRFADSQGKLLVSFRKGKNIARCAYDVPVYKPTGDGGFNAIRNHKQDDGPVPVSQR